MTLKLEIAGGYSAVASVEEVIARICLQSIFDILPLSVTDEKINVLNTH